MSSQKQLLSAVSDVSICQQNNSLQRQKTYGSVSSRKNLNKSLLNIL